MLYQTDPEVMAWLRELAAEILSPDRLESLVTQINSTIGTEVPEVSADRELRRDLDASSRDQGQAFLTWMSGDSAEVIPPPSAHALARTIARRGLHLRILMQIYRAGHRAILGYQAEIVGRHEIDPALEVKSMIRLAERASHWLNVTLEILTDTYMAERERGLHGRYAQRAETVAAIVRGDILDERSASMAIGYRVGGFNTALVLWADDEPSVDPSDRISDLEDLAQRLAETIGTNRVLSVPSGSRGLWSWLSTDTAPDPAAMVDGFPPVRPTGLHVAAGEAGTGIEGFRRSHQEALAAQTSAELRSTDNALTRYTDIEVAHLLDGRPDAATAMTYRELHGLTGDDPDSAQLRATLRAYLNAHCSPEVAARTLGVHKNTVRYRMQKVEDLFGYRVQDSNTLKLQLALEHAACFGSIPPRP